MNKKLTILFLCLASFQIGKTQFTASIFPQDVCYGTPTQFYGFSSPTSATNWHWDFGNGDTSIVQNPIYTYNSPGSYTVTLIASDGVSIDTATNVAYVYPIPYVDFIYNINIDTVNFYDQSFPNIVTWNWDLGNGSFSQVQNPQVIYSFPPDSCYSVILTVINMYACLNSITKSICITNIKEVRTKNINIYPSPINNTSTLSITGELKGLSTILTYDILGNRIKIPTIIKSDNEINLTTNQLEKGTYFISLLFENDTPITKKIIVQ